VRAIGAGEVAPFQSSSFVEPKKKSRSIHSASRSLRERDAPVGMTELSGERFLVPLVKTRDFGMTPIKMALKLIQHADYPLRGVTF
jgi:hypothetical protein